MKNRLNINPWKYVKNWAPAELSSGGVVHIYLCVWMCVSLCTVHTTWNIQLRHMIKRMGVKFSLYILIYIYIWRERERDREREKEREREGVRDRDNFWVMCTFYFLHIFSWKINWINCSICVWGMSVSVCVFVCLCVNIDIDTMQKI